MRLPRVHARNSKWRASLRAFLNRRHNGNRGRREIQAVTRPRWTHLLRRVQLVAAAWPLQRPRLGGRWPGPARHAGRAHAARVAVPEGCRRRHRPLTARWRRGATCQCSREPSTPGQSGCKPRRVSRPGDAGPCASRARGVTVLADRQVQVQGPLLAWQQGGSVALRNGRDRCGHCAMTRMHDMSSTVCAWSAQTGAVSRPPRWRLRARRCRHSLDRSLRRGLLRHAHAAAHGRHAGHSSGVHVRERADSARRAMRDRL